MLLLAESYTLDLTRCKDALGIYSEVLAARGQSDPSLEILRKMAPLYT